MLIDHNEAREIYRELKWISEECLKKINCRPEPDFPRRVRRWRNGRPKGILFHYTGGASGMKALKWCNHPGWGNTGSSWHVTIFDRKPDNTAGERWDRLADKSMQALFPVPTIINASWDLGTWHGNWSNNVCLGIENRNMGRGPSIGTAKDGTTMILDKPAVDVKGQIMKIGANVNVYESFTRGQIIANANIGHVMTGYWNQPLDPTWMLPHHAVWATKADTGSPFVFPIAQLRSNIGSDISPDSGGMDLGEYPDLGHSADDDGTWWDVEANEVRCDLEPIVVPWDEPDAFIDQEDPNEVDRLLNRMGYHVTGDPVNRSRAVRIFQRSTSAFRKRGRARDVLKTDGVVGPKTKKALTARIAALQLP